MSTLRQIEANRRNAQKSTGPASVTGKTVSSMNNLKTGIHAKSLVLPYENLADLQQLVEECYLHYHPASPSAPPAPSPERQPRPAPPPSFYKRMTALFPNKRLPPPTPSPSTPAFPSPPRRYPTPWLPRPIPSPSPPTAVRPATQI